jgi:hypothetical protein
VKQDVLVLRSLIKKRRVSDKKHGVKIESKHKFVFTINLRGFMAHEKKHEESKHKKVKSGPKMEMHEEHKAKKMPAKKHHSRGK